MPVVRRSKALRLFWRVHRWLFQISSGRIGASLLGHRVLLLVTTGRKSGQPRPVTLYYFPAGQGYLVVASNAGDPRDPGWYLNLKANPKATAMRAEGWQPVLAREVEGPERERLWDLVVQKDSSYQEYQNRMSREIPLIVLEPVQGG